MAVVATIKYVFIAWICAAAMLCDDLLPFACFISTPRLSYGKAP